jgi:hypothetical protein
MASRYRVEKVGNGKLCDLLKFIAMTGFVGWLVIGIPSAIKLVRYFNCSHWGVVQGEVVSSKITMMTTTGSNGCSVPVIKYSFEYRGEKKESTTWGFRFFSCSSSKWASDISNKWPKGENVNVYLDRNSGRSILDPDLSALWLIQAIGISCFTLNLYLHKKGKSQQNRSKL